MDFTILWLGLWFRSTYIQILDFSEMSSKTLLLDELDELFEFNYESRMEKLSSWRFRKALQLHVYGIVVSKLYPGLSKSDVPQ